MSTEQTTAGHSIRRMGPETMGDMRHLLGHPPEGWCWCVAWEVPSWEGWGDRTAEQNRELKEQLWAGGAFHGYVFYLHSGPAGWCRVGPTSAWPKFCRERGVPSSDEVYAFTCFGMRPEYRRQGHLGAFLQLVLQDLAASGVSKVLAAPKPLTGEQDDGHLWNGPASLFHRLGFIVQRGEEKYKIMELSLSSVAGHK